MPAKQKSKNVVSPKEDNPNAFKHLINPKTVAKISHAIVRVYPEFRSSEFLKVQSELAPLEMKQRVKTIAAKLDKTLPFDREESLQILLRAIQTNELDGFELWPFSEYIANHGLDYFDLSMRVMYEMTSQFTAEFAIRPFLIKNQKEVLQYFKKWAKDSNRHIRRWVSEGSRPLLPWGLRIPSLVKDPTPTFELLDRLKFDEELYVRKSVANHLNDVSKHHPQKVILLLQKWNQDSATKHESKVEWITRHALRTLIKKGNADALKLIGVSAPKVSVKNIRITTPTVKVGESLQFQFEIASNAKTAQKLAVDYAIGFVRANGKLGFKVYKLKTFELKAGEKIIISKTHSFKRITTLKYFAGKHELIIQINGQKQKPVSFALKH